MESKRGETMNTTTSNGAIGPSSTTRYTLQEAIDYIGFGWFQYKVVLLTGLCFMYEATGAVTLSLLGSLIKCNFQLTPLQQASIPTIGLIGMCMSNPLWGKMADLYGRRMVLIISVSLMSYFGILTAFSPNLPWIYINLFLTGICFGGTFQSATLCSEYAPTKQRIRAIIILEGMYSSAAVALNVLAKVIVPSFGWRWFLLASSVPGFLFTGMAFCLPESARFLLVSGRYSAAQGLVERMARDNGRQPPEGSLSSLVDTEQRLGKMADLFSKRLIRVSIPLIIAWFGTGVCYFGISVITPTVFVEADGCHGSDAEKTPSVSSCLTNCRELSGDDFTSLVIASFGELSALPVALALMLFLGRRTSLVVLFSIHSLSSFVSMICMPRVEITGVMFITRNAAAALFAVLIIFSTEVYPTTCRSIGVGINGAVYKLGALVAPAIGQALTSYRVSLGFLTFGLLGVSGIVAVYLIPIETKNKKLKDTESETEDEP